MKNKKGFSIIEMIAVAVIISIISTAGFNAWKSMQKQSLSFGAKANLAIVHSAQEKYKANCGIYHPDLEVIGAIPLGEVHYNIGGKFDASDFTAGSCQSIGDGGCANNNACMNQYLKDACSNSLDDFKLPANKDKDCYFKKSEFIVDLASYITNTASMNASICDAMTNSCNIKTDTYTVFAAGDLKKKKTDSEYDIWVINHRGLPKHVQKGY